jgi:hypothetical protein
MSKGILPGCGVPAVPDCAQASVPHKTANAIRTNESRKNRTLSAIANLSLPDIRFLRTARMHRSRYRSSTLFSRLAPPDFGLHPP